MTTPPPGLQEERLEPVLAHHDRHPWAQPGDEPERWWILRFADRDMREMVWRGPDAEREAREAYARYCPAWNCYLFAAVEARPTTPADGLVEALKSVLSKIGVAESCLEAMGHLRNKAGYLTDAGLWLDRAASECRQALSPKEPTP